MYNKLITKPFLYKCKKQNINEKILINELKNCYNNIAFSTFPYIKKSMGSMNSIKKTNSGNCIGLSMYIKHNLKKKYNIKSYLIPSTIPQYLIADGYLDISHVVLAIPLDELNYFIVDPSFYFLKPIKINLTNNLIGTVTSMCIYSNKVNKIKTSKKMLNKRIIFNEYQSIPKNTYFCECYYDFNPNDKWVYFLREITNPDLAVTSFFIGIKKLPFFVSTKFIDNKCLKDISIRTYDNDILSIYIDNNKIYKGKKKLIPKLLKLNLENYINNKNFDNSIIY